MKNRFMSICLSVLAAAIAWCGPFAVASAAEAIPGEYLVKYNTDPFVALTSMRSIAGVRLADHNEDANLVKVKVDLAEEVESLARLFADPNVEYVVPNIRIRVPQVPFEGLVLKEQWAIQKVNAEAAWAKAGNKGSRNVVVAVIDTGVDYNHESLKANMVAGYDFRENDSDPYDQTSSKNPGHGTHCAGIIGATGLVDGGIVGISPEVSLMPLRFLGEDGSGDLNAGIKAIDHAIKSGADVISASWGATIGRSQAMPLVEAVKRADDAGVIFVSAAANDGRNNDATEVYPANNGFPNSITVAASGPNDEKPSWSNYGKRTVHLASPGLNIMSTLPQNKYGNLSGTSMATPLVSGLVAFLKSQDESLTGAQSRALLQLTGAKVGIETACDCRVDALAAVQTVLDKKMFITPAAGTLGVGETLQFSGTYGKPPFEFSVANSSVGTITSQGVFTAAAIGETTVTVKDAGGASSTSLTVRVADKNQKPPGGGNCPLGDQALCDILCQIQPSLPFCNQ